MEDHEHWSLLSALVDGELSVPERAAVEGHLAGCASCRREVEDLRAVRRLASSAPRRAMPPGLLADLEGRFARPSPPSWRERLAAWTTASRLLVPAGVSAAAVLIAGLWLGLKGTARPDELPLELLLAAHSRYTAGSMVPGGDLTDAEYSGHLADYHELR